MTIKYLFFLILFPFLSCSPQNIDKEIKLTNHLKSMENSHLDNDSILELLSTKEFNHILKGAYEAIEIASSDLIKISKTDVNYKKANRNLRRGVTERYSYIIETLMRIPVFVKAKIISSQEVNKDTFAQINLILKPEYIIKGKEPFLTQTEFEVYYRKYEFVSESKDYKVGKSYLFPIWDRGEARNEIFGIATWISGEDSRFLIEDNILHDQNNFFKMGTEVNWNDFVENFKEMIECIIKEKGLEKYKMPNIYRRGR